jgi:DNA-binding MarR family transcriptional regulator
MSPKKEKALKEHGGRPGARPNPNHAFQEDPDASIGYLIRDTHRAFARLLQERIEKHNVSMGLWYFLRALWQEDGLTQRQLSERVRTMEPTTASALDSMEKRGLVVRVRNSHDRRKINVHLTRKGRALKKVLLPYAAETNALASKHVSISEIKMLRAILQKMRANLDDGQNAGLDLD